MHLAQRVIMMLGVAVTYRATAEYVPQTDSDVGARQLLPLAVVQTSSADLCEGSGADELCSFHPLVQKLVKHSLSVRNRHLLRRDGLTLHDQEEGLREHTSPL